MKNKIWFTRHSRPNNPHRVMLTSRWESCPAPGSPLRGPLIIHQVLSVTLPGAEEVAVLVVRVGVVWPVVAVVEAPLVIVTCVQTAPEAGHWHQEVDCRASAPESTSCNWLETGLSCVVKIPGVFLLTFLVLSSTLGREHMMQSLYGLDSEWIKSRGTFQSSIL